MKIKLLIISILISGCSYTPTVHPYTTKDDARISNIKDISGAYFLSVEGYSLDKAKEELDSLIQKVGIENNYNFYYILSTGEITSTFKNTASIRLKYFKKEKRYDCFKEYYDIFGSPSYPPYIEKSSEIYFTQDTKVATEYLSSNASAIDLISIFEFPMEEYKSAHLADSSDTYRIFGTFDDFCTGLMKLESAVEKLWKEKGYQFGYVLYKGEIPGIDKISIVQAIKFFKTEEAFNTFTTSYDPFVQDYFERIED
ncbi:MAG: hypothetical protein HOK52_09030 [Candidatus Marinimicrobia bacterium]|nr:hypothetical protein [Candidatus Neomarinimicrobiota bacterium]